MAGTCAQYQRFKYIELIRQAIQVANCKHIKSNRIASLDSRSMDHFTLTLFVKLSRAGVRQRFLASLDCSLPPSPARL